MVEYGVAVANMFGTLNDDELEDPEVMLKRAEATSKKEDKGANQKKADRTSSKKKKEVVFEPAKPREKEEKESIELDSTHKTYDEKYISNKENLPDDKVGGRISRGSSIRGRNFVRFSTDDKKTLNETMGERFGDNRGRYRGRSFRGGYSRRGGGYQNGNEHDNPPNIETPVLNDTENEDTFNEMDARTHGVFKSGENFRRGDRSIRSRGAKTNRFLDRNSGSDKTGVKSTEKREGAGKHNWGTHKTDVSDEMNRINSLEDSKIETNDCAQIKIEGPQIKMEEDIKEFVPEEVTYDEFKAKNDAGRLEPQFNIRKAGEGANEDDSVKLVPLAKHDVEKDHVDELIAVRRGSRMKRVKIEINFNDDQRGRGIGRGRNVGFRMDRDHRMDRSENCDYRRSQQFEVSADAFPALGTTH